MGKSNNNIYDWDALKLEFLQGHWETTSEFRFDKGISSEGKENFYAQKKMEGWEDDRKNLGTVMVKQIENNVPQNNKEEEKKVRERQVNIARFLQLKGMEALQSLFPKDAEEARKLILAGMQEERIALGISEKGGSSQNLTQVNVNLPKTKFDEILDGQNIEELLEFIADIRRERLRRTRANSISQNQTNP